MSVTQNFFLTFYNRRKNHYSFLSILNDVNYSEFFSYFFIITEKNLLLLSFYFSFPFLLPSLSCPSLPPSLSLPPLSLPQQRHERTRSWVSHGDSNDTDTPLKAQRKSQAPIKRTEKRQRNSTTQRSSLGSRQERPWRSSRPQKPWRRFEITGLISEGRSIVIVKITPRRFVRERSIVWEAEGTPRSGTKGGNVYV